jgi:hypothetical protein
MTAHNIKRELFIVWATVQHRMKQYQYNLKFKTVSSHQTIRSNRRNLYVVYYPRFLISSTFHMYKSFYYSFLKLFVTNKLQNKNSDIYYTVHNTWRFNMTGKQKVSQAISRGNDRVNFYENFAIFLWRQEDAISSNLL